MQIREVTPSDYVWIQIEQIFPSSVGWVNSPEDDGDYRFFAAVDERDTVLGGSVIEIGTLYFGPLDKVSAGFLEDLEVLPQHRRKGVGRAVLCAALDCAWEAGCESVRSTVDYDATAALALYRKVGFGFVPEEDPDAPGQPDRTYSIVAINPKRVATGYGALHTP